jgi:hypothetical protein
VIDERSKHAPADTNTILKSQAIGGLVLSLYAATSAPATSSHAAIDFAALFSGTALPGGISLVLL